METDAVSINSQKPPSPMDALKSSSSPKAGSLQENNGLLSGYGSKNILTPIRGDKPHNLAVLRNQINNPTPFMLHVSDEDIRRGKPGLVKSCAISECAKEHWGKNCNPHVGLNKKTGITELHLSIPDLEVRERYVAELTIFPGGFDPEDYDGTEGSRSGGVIIRNVSVGPMPIDTLSDEQRNAANAKRNKYERKDEKKRRGWTMEPVKPAKSRDTVLS